MINSMTGFGRGEQVGLGYHFSVEIKSVNHRYQEVMVKIPRNFNPLEERIRKFVQEKVHRGRVEVYVNVKETEEKKRFVKVDKELALSYDMSLKELAKSLNTTYITDIYRLVALPEIIILEEQETDIEAVWPYVETAVREALAQLIIMRQNEGEKLAQDLLQRLKDLKELTGQIKERAPLVVSEYQQKLRQRLEAMLTDIALDENRLLMEVALFADRASIAEELVRLESHMEQFEEALRQQQPVGRKLDFLVQEMNREINTIGSKANDLLISRLVVEGKSQLEKIREQVQNIE